jgi:uncharacterized protein DUF4082
MSPVSPRRRSWRLVEHAVRLAVVFVAGVCVPLLVGGHPATAAPQCPCSLFGSATPSLVDLPAADGRSGDGQTDEMGLRITVAAPARLTAIRFYKDPLETGTHTGRLWDASGQQLAEASFDSETASGWQSAPLATPFDLEPGETYTVSVNINAYFVDQYDALDNEIVSGPIHTVADGNNGVFARAAGEYPTLSYRSSNYFVDAVVDDTSDNSEATTTTTTTTATTDTTTTTTTTNTTTTDTTTDPTTTATTTGTTTDTTTTAAAPTTTPTTTTPAATPTPPTSSPPTSGQPPANPPAGTDASPAAAAFSATVTVSTTKSKLPPAPATPKWPLRVWFTLTTPSPAPAKLQFAQTPLQPWAWRPYRNQITLRTRTHSIWIRFADTTGNPSNWRKLSIP